MRFCPDLTIGQDFRISEVISIFVCCCNQRRLNFFLSVLMLNFIRFLGFNYKCQKFYFYWSRKHRVKLSILLFQTEHNQYKKIRKYSEV